MAYFLKAKRLDVETGSIKIALLNEREAKHFGIRAGDNLRLTIGKRSFYVAANTAATRVKPGQIGLYKDVWVKHRIPSGTIVEVAFKEEASSIRAIKRRLMGKRLNYQEYFSIMKDISEDRLSKVHITYFVASGFMHEYTNEELYYMTKAMAEAGEQLNFGDLVADKHSVGGLAGNRTTPIVVSIIASLGIKIPKTSSRAITSPAGTADTVEVIAPVTKSAQEIKKIVQKADGCFVWGGGVNLAPADDKILDVTYPLAMEPLNKMAVSIMAKKVAAGIKYLVIDMPVGPSTKIQSMGVANKLAEKFVYLGKRFGIKVKVVKFKTDDPVGKGVGPALEARDVLRVLQRKNNRPGDLESKAVHLAGALLELIGYCKKGEGPKIAWEELDSGRALKKAQQIIQLQGGKPKIDSESITLGAHKKYYNASKSGKIIFTDNAAINLVCRSLGAPRVKLAGIYLNKEFGVKVKKGERLFTLYAEDKERLKLAVKSLEKLRVYRIS